MTEHVPDLVQAVIGYRAWRVEDGLLRSGGAGEAIWDPDVTVAECEGYDKMGPLGLGYPRRSPQEAAEAYGLKIEPHDAPAKDCGCGLYAYHDPKMVAGTGSAESIWGAVAAWGRLEVHREGLRAERARVVALALDDYCVDDSQRRPMIEQLAKIYGARAVPSYLLIEEAEQHGIAVPDEQRPEPDAFQPGGRITTGYSYHGTFHSGGVASGSYHAVATQIPRPGAGTGVPVMLSGHALGPSSWGPPPPATPDPDVDFTWGVLDTIMLIALVVGMAAFAYALVQLIGGLL